MELFRNTNIDFLGKKWIFIAFSIVVTVVGVASLVKKGGPKYGIDFKGGVELRVRFKNDPPVDKIRAALAGKIPGEVEIQPVLDATGRGAAPELLIGTEISDETRLNVNRDAIDTTLRDMFGGSDGKPDLNNASASDLANLLRGPLQAAGVPLSEDDLQKLLVSIKEFGVSKGGIINSLDDLSAVPGVTPAVINALKQNVSVGQFSILSAEQVGPKIGAELRSKAIYATLYALAGMLVYIAFRFEWIYGVAAVIAVFHDTIMTIGLFSLFDKEITLTVVAALLTLVGYSMNDTIVVFDRIRENVKTMRREPMPSLINLSINQTLSRTVMASGLTFLTALSLWLFGGKVLEGFAFALVVGITVGTYSSIFIASPILVAWQDFMASRGGKPTTVAAAAPAATVKKR
ncbi:MAG: protein translocase subunit SecF [Acidobacteriota bacterium]